MNVGIFSFNLQILHSQRYTFVGILILKNTPIVAALFDPKPYLIRPIIWM